MSGYFDSLNRRARMIPMIPTPPPVEAPAVRPRLALPPTIPTEYGALRERLLVEANGKPLKTLVFAGCSGDEGCTEVVREFAATLAGSGFKVLVVDAEGRTPEAAPQAAAPSGKGELSVVASPASGPDRKCTFGDPEFATWLEGHRSHYDYVLFDAPPLLRFADGALMGRVSDGLVIVVQAEVTERASLVRAREQLERARVNIVGVVLQRAHNTVPARLRPYLSME